MTRRQMFALADSLEATALSMDMLERSARDTARDVRTKARVLIAQATAMPEDLPTTGVHGPATRESSAAGVGQPNSPPVPSSAIQSDEPERFPRVIFDAGVRR